MEENENREERRGGEKKVDKLPPMFGHFCCRLAVQPYCRSVLLFEACRADSGYFVREEPVLSGSLAVRKIGGTWQEECWVRTIKFLGVDKNHMTAASNVLCYRFN